MNCLFLYNPNSGKGKLKKKISYVRRHLEEKFERVDIVETKSAEDMEAHARDGAERYDVILFSGGDGTFNNVLTGIGDRKIPLGYIPSGTTNDIAHSVGIPRSVKGALKVILAGHSAPLDCLRVNDTHYVMYIAAAGAFTEVTYNTPQKSKKLFGRIAYAVQGLKKNMKFKVFPVRCHCGGQVSESHGVLVFVVNGKWVAGMPVNKKGSMTDGRLEVAVVKQVKRPNVFQRLGKYFSVAAVMLFGVRVKKRDVEFMRGDSVLIETSDDVVWDFDGEEGPRGNVDIRLLRGHVNLFVPKNKKL
ncbi:MAG: diacylglycerol kinase family lipid kinase [Clostridia bacterium]|nr:diacylglycerol kinase family lipid kinase [Clostridia bacterium]